MQVPPTTPNVNILRVVSSKDGNQENNEKVLFEIGNKIFQNLKQNEEEHSHISCQPSTSGTIVSVLVIFYF